MARRSTRERADFKWRNRKGCWLKDSSVVDDDFEWLGQVERLYLSNVKLPIGFLARFENLWWLSIQGGSGIDLGYVRGVRGLRFLSVNQVRGMTDLSVLSKLADLRYLSFYGLPQLQTLPSCKGLTKLERAELGHLRGLTSMKELLDAPQLRELLLKRKINVNADDVERIASHPTLEKFGWFAEDVPIKSWKPVVERINLPNADPLNPEEWFSLDETGMPKSPVS